MDNQEKEFIYEQWQSGIADNPEDGFANIRNMNVDRYPGAITPGFQTVQTSQVSWASGVTITAISGNSITVSSLPAGAVIYVGQAISFSGSLPASITAGTIYYIQSVSGNTITIADTLNHALFGGGTIIVTSAFVAYGIIAGGGGGGSGLGSSAGGSGGGAGGYLHSTSASHQVTPQAYPITVGTGGTANISGNNSTFDSITSTGGGANPGSTVGGNGGSGSGGEFAGNAGGTGIAGQGFHGGAGNAGVIQGGGGGSASIGIDGGAANTGHGGGGTAGAFDITGSGGVIVLGGLGGTSGTPTTNNVGGNGGTAASPAGGAGVGNGGGGGGGGGNPGGAGGTGANGTVVIAYLTGSVTATGGTITTSGSYTIHTFTTSGTWTVSAVSIPTGGGVTTVNMTNVLDIKTWYNQQPNTVPFVFAIDDTGQVWQQIFGGSNITGYTQAGWYLLGAAAGNVTTTSYSLCTFTGSDGNGWLFATKDNYVHALKISNTLSTSWNDTFINLNTYYWHRGFVSQSNYIYFTDGAYVAMLAEVKGQAFDASNSSTYSVQLKAIQLPFSEISSCLENLGSNLMIGGLNSNFIYPCDEVQQSATAVTATGTLTVNYFLVGAPLRCAEKSVYQLKNIANVLYILAGVKGIIYYSTGYSIIPLKKIPEYITGGSVQWGGIEKINGNLLFGFVGSQNQSTGVQIGGVGKIYLTEQAYMTSAIPQGSFVIDQTPSSGAENINIPALCTYQNTGFSQPTAYETYYIGSTNIIDAVDTIKTRTDNSSYVECALEHVSPLKEGRTFQSVGVKLLQPLASTQNVTISYRNALNGSYSGINSSTNTFTASTPANGSLTNPFASTQISKQNIVQLKISLASDTSYRDPIVSTLYLQ